MKKRLSKRLLSLFLAVVLMATGLPFVGLVSASAADKATSTNGAYLLAYFKNSDKSTNGENVFYAVSKDGYNFEALNDQSPVLSATMGSGHSRDPFILKAEDGAEYKYYMVATDDDTTSSTGYNNTGIHTWGTNDLINWTELANPQFAKNKGDTSTITNMCWAPEAIYDPVAKHYMVYFSMCDDGSDGANERSVIYYSYTDDFKTFSEPQVLFNMGYGIIDANITKTDTGYIMWLKNETSSGTGAKTIFYVTKTGTSPSPADGNAYDKNTAQVLDTVSQINLEGPEMYNIAGTGTYVLMADKFNGNSGFNMYLTSDFKSYTQLGTSEYTIIQLGLSHGSVVHISDAEYTALSDYYGKQNSTQTNIPAGQTALDHMVARYFATTNPAEDASGHGNHIGDYNGDGTTEDAGDVHNITTVVKDGKLCGQFTANGADSNSPDKGSYAWTETAKMLSNANYKTGVTISFDMYLDSSSSDTHIFDFHDGSKFNPGFRKIASNMGSHNAFLNETDGQVYSYKGTDMTNNGDVNFGSIATKEWHNYTISVSNKYLCLYVDGTQVASKEVSRMDEDWFNKVFKNGNVGTDSSYTSKLTIGVSCFYALFGSDKLLDGYLSNFCIYDRALSLSDVQSAQELLNKAPAIDYNASDDIYKDAITGYTDAQTSTDDTYGTVLNVNGSAVASTADPVNDLADDSTTGYSYGMFYNPGDTIDSGSVFRMGGDSDQYWIINEDGTMSFKNGTSTFTTPQLFELETNKWQYVQISVVPYVDYDRIFVYIDGKKVTMYDCYKVMETQDGTTATYPLNNGTKARLLDLIHATATNTAAVTYGEGATGQIADVEIFRGCADPDQMYAAAITEYAEKIIQESMQAFKDKMAQFGTTDADGNVIIWNNVQQAYDLYDKASRYMDSVKYGETELDIDYLVQLNKSLLDAVNGSKDADGNVLVEGMTRYTYTPWSANAQAKYNGTAVTNQAYNNLLYSQDMTDAAHNNTSSDEVQLKLSSATEKFAVYYGSQVFLFDSSKTTDDNTNPLLFPIVYTQSNSESKNGGRISGVYPNVSSTDTTDSSLFRLAGAGYNTSTGVVDTSADNCWHGYSEGTWSGDLSYSLSGSDLVGADKANSHGHYSDWFSWINNKSHYWYNVVQFLPYAYMKANNKTTPEGKYIASGTSTDGYNGTFAWTFYGNEDKGTGGYDSAEKKATTKQTKSTIYVVDISNVKSAQAMFDTLDGGADAFYKKMQNITDYTSETASAVSKVVDDATSFDPGDYNFTDGSVDEVYNNLVNDKNTLLDEFNKAAESMQLKDQDTDGYKNLREDIGGTTTTDESGQTVTTPSVYTEAYNDLTTSTPETSKYTTSSSNELVQAYQDVLDHFTNLSPAGNDAKYVSAEDDTATQLHEALDLAYRKLMPKADYSALTTLQRGLENNNINQAGLGSSDNQHYTLTTWLAHQTADTAAKNLVNDAPTDGAQYTQVQKWDQPMYTTNDDGTRNEDSLSDYQTDINDKKDALDAAIKGMEVPVDYTAYDAFVVVLGTQDQNAFTDEYLAQDGYVDKEVKNVFKAQSYQGSKSAAGAYNTDGTDNDRAYVEYDGACYRNIGQPAADTEQTGQKALDSTTTSLVTALNVANNSDTDRRQYKVTFKYVVDNAAAITAYADNSVYYGTQVDFAVPDGVQGSVYKWTVTIDGTTKDVLNYGTNYSLRMQNENSTDDAIVVTVYLTTNADLQEDQVNLTIQDQYQAAWYKTTVVKTTEVTVSGEEQVVLGSDTLKLGGSGYYKLAGWQVLEGDKVHNINYGTYTMADLAKIAGSSDVTLRPVYVYNDSVVYSVKVDGEEQEPKPYDTIVTVEKKADAYALAVKASDGSYAVITYGDSYMFYVDGSDKEFFNVYKLAAETDEESGEVTRAAGYYVTDGDQVRVDTTAELTYALEHQFPMVYSVGLQATSAATMFSTYSAATTGLPDGVEITEMGTLYTRNADNATAANFTVDKVAESGSGVKMLKAKSPIDFSNQFILNYKNANTATATTYTRAYVKYTYTYETELITGGIKTTTVQCIAYGNICNNSAFQSAATN